MNLFILMRLRLTVKNCFDMEFSYLLSFTYKCINILFFHLQTVNIVNAYDDPRFDPNVDDGTNFRHKTILCMAIKNSLGQIIGVIQLINKFDDLVSQKICFS